MRVLAIVLSTPFIELAAVLLAIIWMVRDITDKVRPLLVIALTVNLFYGILLSTFMGAEGSLLPWKYDAILWRLDAVLRLPTQAMARALQGHWHAPLETTYQLMVPLMVAWFLVVRRAGRGGALVLAYVAELLTGPLLYAMVPACGPVYAFKADWLHVTPKLELMRLPEMPNAFPSLHIGTAFVLLLFAPGRWSRAVATVLFALTALATIASGEHYLIDLLPGIAFGCFAAEAGLRRWRPALAMLGLALAWSLLVRFEYVRLIAHPAALQALAGATVIAAAITVSRFWRLPATEGANRGAKLADAPAQTPPVHMGETVN